MTRKALRTVAIDGPAASGKTTVGRMLADTFGYALLDTGLMYRAVCYAALVAGVSASDARGCHRVARGLRIEARRGEEPGIFVNGEDVRHHLRDPDVEAMVSDYSAIPEVRAVMVKKQRAFANGRRTVLVGRDIGTVVLPDAGLKIYLDAGEDVRAQRRSAQTENWKVQRTAATSKQEITNRDRTDAGRSVSPLRPAENAVLIDTTEMTLEEVLERVEKEVLCAQDSDAG